MRVRTQLSLLCGLLALVVFAETPGTTAFSHELQKLAHPATFGVVALLVLSIRRKLGHAWLQLPIGEYPAAWLIAVLLGAGTEIAQFFSHRSPSLLDVGRDAVGALAALTAQWALLAAGAGRGARAAALCAAALAALLVVAPVGWCLAAYAHRDVTVPTLAQFRMPLDLYFVDTTKSDLDIVPVPERWARASDDAALSVPLIAIPYDGVSLKEPFPDWRGHQSLLIEMTNPTASDEQMTLRVQDRAHNQEFDDRFNRNFLLPAGQRTVIRVSLADVLDAPRGRHMDPRHMSTIVIFRSSGRTPQGMLLHRIWLD